jgi:hypothetical protein
MSRFGKKRFTNSQQRINQSHKNVRGAVNHYLTGMKRRRGDGANTANNASLQGLKSDTRSGQGKDKRLCVEITHIYITTGKKRFSTSHFGILLSLPRMSFPANSSLDHFAYLSCH